MRSVKLGSLVQDTQSGFASGNDDEQGIVQIRMNNVSKDGALVWTKVRRVPRPKNIDRLLVKSGDVLFNATNSPDLVGKNALFTGYSEPVTFSNHFIRLRFDPLTVHSAFVCRVLQDLWSKRIFAGMCKQWVNQASVSKEDLLALHIPFPPLAAQKQIAAILDQADNLVRKRRQTIELLDDLPQAIFAKMFGDPTENPLNFNRVSLGDIIDFVGGSQPPKSTFLYEDGPDRVRFVQIRDFRTDEYKTYVPAHLAKRPFTEEDVMIGRYGPPVFQIFRGLAGTYNVALMKAAPKDGILNDFVFYLLQEPRLHSYVVANSDRTAGQSGVNLRLLENYPAFRPPLALQKEFRNRVNYILVLREQQRSQLAKLDTLFASLQHRAFNGELTAKAAERELAEAV